MERVGWGVTQGVGQAGEVPGKAVAVAPAEETQGWAAHNAACDGRRQRSRALHRIFCGARERPSPCSSGEYTISAPCDLNPQIGRVHVSL